MHLGALELRRDRRQRRVDQLDGQLYIFVCACQKAHLAAILVANSPCAPRHLTEARAVPHRESNERASDGRVRTAMSYYEGGGARLELIIFLADEELVHDDAANRKVDALRER